MKVTILFFFSNVTANFQNIISKDSLDGTLFEFINCQATIFDFKIMLVLYLSIFINANKVSKKLGKY